MTSNMLNFNDNSFRNIALNDLSAINHDIEDYGQEDLNTSVLSVRDNLENLISSHRHQLKANEDDDDSEEDELYNPSVSGLLSMKDSPINTARDRSPYGNVDTGHRTSQFNNDQNKKNREDFDSFKYTNKNLRTDATTDIDTTRYETSETRHIKVFNENVNIQNINYMENVNYLNISDHMLGDKLNKMENDNQEINDKENNPKVKSAISRSVQQASRSPRGNFNKFNSTAKFQQNTFKSYQNQSVYSANQSMLNCSINSKDLAHVPSLSIGIANHSFLKKKMNVQQNPHQILPKLEQYPECVKLESFDPCAVNREQEINQDLLDVAQSLLDMCKSLQTTVRQNIACQKSKVVINISSEFDDKNSLVKNQKDKLWKLHHINVY